MKPAQIRVFDGLRLTSEHLEHLQQAMISTVQDLREIAGADRVYRGLEVELANGSITVKPGLAFDAQKNRIAIDEPQTVQLAFGDDELEKYVCAKYESVEEGEIDTHFTIVWDSGSILVRPTLPEPADNLLPLAKVIRQQDGTQQVVQLGQSTTATVGALRTGVETFTSGNAEFDLRKSVLGQPADVSKWDDLLFEREIEVPRLSDAVRFFLELSMVLQWKEENPTASDAAPVNRALTATSHGDAYFPVTGQAQHVALTTVQYVTTGTVPAGWASCVTTQGVAVIGLKPLVGDLAATDPVPSALQPLVVAVRVERGRPGRFRVRGGLRFADNVVTGRAEGVERFAISLKWDARFGWSV